MTDMARIDWEALKAARLKYRRAVVMAERQTGQPLVHTLYKLGAFLDEATYGAFRGADGPPDYPDGSSKAGPS